MNNNDSPTSALVILDKEYTYPPLPPITDAKLEEVVFTHRSLVNALPVSMRGDMESYDKLAHVGDSLLSEASMLSYHQPWTIEIIPIYPFHVSY
ncbi:hypothetical protein I204_06845 [Kwoniella mangroviensis CBS 8886]|uniref:uncharacterized protein n=1 Tax=Kwoniella mangroviensis CBS 8507 TaxID=1296122 RepID=UPI00080D1536|nr:uncharacterized protein I203_01183 [Kwoniella mangroviensis CBS 8507]OCF69326.1 hypothetical protein I203_01183 [Kwoniella mangroviensis CBS 8507]OCF72466.1 hypothetical protein I204_06845 [Kwoniella mangroviensis CBS 8886]